MGIEAYQRGNYTVADSLLTLVIDSSKGKLTLSMPESTNPNFYRGSNYIELNKYKEALLDMDHVSSDTTVNTHVLIVRSEAFKMLKQYDTAISICNRLLKLHVDSLAILTQRGICFYFNGQIDKACLDFNYCRKLGADTSFLNQFLKYCK